ncbi:uncharacterized protein BDR25DRAFT_235860 [Lindgomyces ingoldianus]|uniref:Uncharacterized protein n=1 Tax=Lindgomyces ingoldianus TaxID=673940 RepID=A0ACB6QK87_9PLEO|nr:uncharacterized protein BDR25DRAFT_235860 [Lindgomyces ingoldianus]KAF2466988.1 hypothetical protein BDR25DRAFT_235860 [Lindgomyces ingoldianus]
MTSTRLRQTFRYPADDSDDPVEGLDEQDQETLISTLSTYDTRTTTLYTRILLALPLSPILLYIPRLFSLETCMSSLASVLCLLATAYILYFLPLPPVSAAANPDPTLAPSSSTLGKGKSISRNSAGHKAFLDLTEPSDLPYLSADQAALVRKFLIPVTGATCLLLAVYEMCHGRTWSDGMTIGGGYVPGFILSVVLWARRELRELDLGELERLRYRYKGA